ncbi:DNA utilization protein GntX [Limihaloglobus sulfuriphilus]|uniref:DNA utilization protein GntX n=1 Tax=Limihaloglobus sulfuriphilus TaxID=1851148 RepID=A0A1Q2MED7_9BACT|nr:ComF family protein [Limihaloglobus sulfuriphilus]AQQ70908.1 DNA utilization protein GntX [Limihaloglobus sulfuriphilus]
MSFWGSRFFKRFHGLINSIAKPAISLIWPPLCQACECSIDDPDEKLCRDCWQDLNDSVARNYCKRCGSDIDKYSESAQGCDFCSKINFNFDGVARVGNYQGCLKNLILQLKFSGRSELAVTLGEYIDASLLGSFNDEEIDFFAPVPVHWTRRISRGWNQSFLIARNIKHFDAKTKNLLIRTRRTRPQPGLSFAQRRKNVKNAFKIRNSSSVQDKTICLIDDVRTSGATLDECAKVLKQAGARRVLAAVAATAGGSSSRKSGTALKYWD